MPASAKLIDALEWALRLAKNPDLYPLAAMAIFHGVFRALRESKLERDVSDHMRQVELAVDRRRDKRLEFSSN